MKEANKQKEKNNIYEIGCLLAPIVSDKDALAEVSNIKSYIEKAAGGFLSGDGPQKKVLAYPIKKMIGGKKHSFDSAYFAWLKFTAEREKLASLKKDLDKNENILRHLLTRALEKDTLVSDSKRFLSKVSSRKESGPVKPVKIVKPQEKTEAEKDKIPEKDAKKTEEEKDLDKTIEKLVIK